MKGVWVHATMYLTVFHSITERKEPYFNIYGSFIYMVSNDINIVSCLTF
jgi:hypothetical protein